MRFNHEAFKRRLVKCIKVIALASPLLLVGWCHFTPAAYNLGIHNRSGKDVVITKIHFDDTSIQTDDKILWPRELTDNTKIGFEHYFSFAGSAVLYLDYRDTTGKSQTLSCNLSANFVGTITFGNACYVTITDAEKLYCRCSCW